MSTTPTTGARTARDEQALHAALAPRERPPRASALSACLTFGWRGMLKVKHVPEQLVDVTITPVLFVLMFTYIFGGAISGSTAEYSLRPHGLSVGSSMISAPKARARSQWASRFSTKMET